MVQFVKLTCLTIMCFLCLSGVAKDYRHDWYIKGRVKVIDITDTCRFKSPHRDLVVYLEEITDFLDPRKVKSDIDKNGEFYFRVENRYQNYTLIIETKNEKREPYKKILYAYNAPKTYDLTVSCIHDIKAIFDD